MESAMTGLCLLVAFTAPGAALSFASNPMDADYLPVRARTHELKIKSASVCARSRDGKFDVCPIFVRLENLPGLSFRFVLGIKDKSSLRAQVIELRRFAAPISHLAFPCLNRQRKAVSVW